MTERVVPPDPALLKDVIDRALVEDGVRQDITTRAVVDRKQTAAATILARADGVVAGLPVAGAVFTAVDPSLEFEAVIADGDRTRPDMVCARITGRLASILSAERVALNFLQRLSGVATITGRVVDALEGLPVRILDTRKTTPGLRTLERYAVRVGGGHNHRFNLSDAILIKDNHLAAARARGLGVEEVLELATRNSPHETRTIIEVTTITEARAALAAGVRWLMLDNMTCDELRSVVREIRLIPDVTIEASGGVTLANVRAIAETGVDVISVGALTHSAPALDLSLEVETE